MQINMAVDKYPQWMNLTPIAVNGTTFAESQTNTNIPDGKVIEVLKLQYQITLPTEASAGAASGDFANQLTINVNKRTQDAMQVLTHQQTIDLVRYVNEVVYGLATEDGGAQVANGEQTVIHDLTDGNGRGPLMAPDAVFLGVQGSNGNMTQTQRARILYRIVTVSALELIQILKQ